MLAVPAVVIGWRLTTANRQRPFNCWLRSGIVAASPGVLAVLAYIVVYWVFRLQNPSTYDGNQLSFAFPQMFVTWFQATVTPLPGWNFLRSNDFSSDLPLLSTKLAAFACAQPFYATKALLVGLSVFVFCYPMAVPTEREKLPLGPLMMVCVIGSLSPNLLMSLTIKHQQVADLAYQPYFYSFYSLPFCLFGGLLLFTTLTTQVSVVARLVFIGGGAVLAGILSLSNDFVSSARVSILRDNNLKWRAADHLESSGCLADLPQNALVYAASLDWGADYWSNYFATRTGRKLAISLESPPNIAVPDETPRFVFSYSSSPTGDGYFWQFGPLAGDVEERRKIQIGEYSKRQRYRLAAFVSTDEVFQIEADGTTFCGQKDSFDGIPIRKREGGSDDTFALQVRSKGFPTFAAVKEPLDSAKPVALNTPLHFAKDGNGTKCLLSGWSQPEAWGVWSDGDHASLLVPLKSVGSDLVLELDVSGFVTSKCPQQLINVRVNEVPVGEIFFSLDRPEGMRRLWISAEVAQREHGKLLIDFRCENPTSPKIAGISEDPRELALALRTLRITD